MIKHGFEQELLAIEAADVAHLVVAEAQEAFDIAAAQHLAAGLQIDVEALGSIGVDHPLGHIHLQSAEGIAEAADHREVHKNVVLHRPTQVLGEFLLHGLGAAVGIEGIGLEWAKAG